MADESIERLFKTAEDLNFHRAVAHGRAQITAKKMMAPYVQEVFSTLRPALEQLMQPLFEKLEQFSNSVPSAPSSPAAGGKKS